MQGAGHAQQRHGRGCPAAFAQTHAQIEQRLRFQRFQYPGVTRLGRGVGEDQPRVESRAQARGDQRRHRRDVAIDQHRHAALTAGDEGTGQGGDLEAADRAQGRQRLARLGMTPQRARKADVAAGKAIERGRRVEIQGGIAGRGGTMGGSL